MGLFCICFEMMIIPYRLAFAAEAEGAWHAELAADLHRRQSEGLFIQHIVENLHDIFYEMSGRFLIIY